MRLRSTLAGALAAVALISTGCTLARHLPAAGSGAAAAPAQLTAPVPAAPPAPVIPADTPAQFVGRMSVNPEHAAAGAVVTVGGTGLPALTRLDVVWHTARGSWKLAGGSAESFAGRRFDPVSQVVASASTDAEGNLSTTFAAPHDFGFEHDITLAGGGVTLNEAAFNLDPTVSIAPQSGPVGTPITVRVDGIGYQYLYNVWQLAYDDAFTGWLSSVTTQGEAVATIPATGAVGRHLIEVLAGAPAEPYLNTPQSPTPDRPSFTLPFTITPGAPVLPVPAPEQGLPRLTGSPPPGGGGPSLWVDPQRASVGTRAEVNGRGFVPGRQVQLTWSRVVGNHMGGGWSEETAPLGEARAGPDGTLSLPFTVPDDLGGRHRIQADQAVTELDITPEALPLSPASGPVGTILTVHLKGGGWTDTASIYALVYDNRYLGYAGAFNSQGDITIQLPAAGEVGWHFIDLYPGISEGQDVEGVSNFRLPQLTFLDHPGERLVPFRFAFQVTGS